MAYPVFDLHCDTATMLSLRNVPADVVMAAGVPEALIPAAGQDLAASSLAVSAAAAGGRIPTLPGGAAMPPRRW